MTDGPGVEPTEARVDLAVVVADPDAAAVLRKTAGLLGIPFFVAGPGGRVVAAFGPPDWTGPAPEIVPTDLEWTIIVPPSLDCDDAAALASPGTEFPPVCVSVRRHQPQIAPRWTNTDYSTGSRVLQVVGRVPERMRPSVYSGQPSFRARPLLLFFSCARPRPVATTFVNFP